MLRKTVQDLKKSNEEKLDKDKHGDLCKIATLEMKTHVSKSIKDTIDEFTEKTFSPALKELLEAIDGGKT